MKKTLKVKYDFKLIKQKGKMQIGRIKNIKFFCFWFNELLQNNNLKIHRLATLKIFSNPQEELIFINLKDLFSFNKIRRIYIIFKIINLTKPKS